MYGEEQNFREYFICSLESKMGAARCQLKNAVCILILLPVVLIMVRININSYYSSIVPPGERTKHPTASRLLITVQPTHHSVTASNETSDTQSAWMCPIHLKHDVNSHRSFKSFSYLEQVSFYNSSVPQDFSEKILLLTPISNSAKKLEHYFRNLCSLSYPHHLISVALGEDSSVDRSYEIASEYAFNLRNYFHNVTVHKLSDKLGAKPRGTRHDREFQQVRRGHLALARNELLARSLADEDWVLWMDSDVKHIPHDIIQHLLSAHQDIVVPTCMYLMADGSPQLYDRNTWRETNESLEFLSKMDKDFLMLEGYSNSARIYLPSLASEGVLVTVDGVGGCVLLIRASCHRKGLVFPPFVIDNHIETEGLAKMAVHMGMQAYGFPRLKVIHF